MKLKHLLFILIAASLSSCTLLNPSILFRTNQNYEFDIPPDTISPQYRISPNDFITFQLFANDGFKIIDMMSNSAGSNTSSQMMMQRGGFKYLVMPDSMVRIPIIGNQKLVGLTIRQAELFLQEKFSEFYNDPYVMLDVVNRRVLIFNGTDGIGKVVPLINENTSLIEALASAGGVSQNGKAYKIKIIRNLRDGIDPEVYEIDLSTIAGLVDADMVMQANDIIYVEPRLNLTSDILREITPVMALIANTIVIIGYLNATK